jgi:hypothetical protein
MFVTIQDGKIGLGLRGGNLAFFDTTDYEGVLTWLREDDARVDAIEEGLLCSSSVDFPEEDGATGFDIVTFIQGIERAAGTGE